MKKSDKLFAFKIAVFNTGLFLFKCGAYNFFDGDLTMSKFGARTFWMGHWVYLFALPLFLGVYCSLTKGKGAFWRYWFPCIYTFSIGVLLALVNFNIPYPSLGMICFMLHVSLIGALATWIRYTNTRGNIVEDGSISEEMKKEWIKEQVNFWRTIVISGTLGMFWVVIPWMQWEDNEAARVIPDAVQEKYTAEGIERKPADIIKQRRIVCEIFRMQVMLQIVYLVLGPIFEGFYKIRRMGDLLLKLKKPT